MTRPTTAHGPCLPLGLVLSLIGGLAIVAAFFMPWFAIQGIILTGEFLGRFLSSTTDLRRFLPGLTGDPAEAQALLALVYLFPASGALVALLALAAALWPARQLPFTILLALASAIPLLAVLLGTSRLPPGASLQVGLWLIGLGAVLGLLGAALHGLLWRPSCPPEPSL